MHNAFNLRAIDLEALDAVYGGGLGRERPGSYDTLGNWVPGRYNMNLDGVDFGTAGPSGLGHADTAEQRAHDMADRFLRENPDYDLVAFDGTLASGAYTSGAYSRDSPSDGQREESE